MPFPDSCQLHYEKYPPKEGSFLVKERKSLPDEHVMCPERESNSHQELRRLLLYPLSYRGVCFEEECFREGSILLDSPIAGVMRARSRSTIHRGG